MFRESMSVRTGGTWTYSVAAKRQFICDLISQAGFDKIAAHFLVERTERLETG